MSNMIDFIKKANEESMAICGLPLKYAIATEDIRKALESDGNVFCDREITVEDANGSRTERRGYLDSIPDVEWIL